MTHKTLTALLLFYPFLLHMNVVLHNFGYKKGDIEKIEKILKQLTEKGSRSG
jgi:hypothetical protein